MGDDDSVKEPVGPLEVNLNGKEISVISFDLQQYSRRKICFTTSRTDEVTTSTRAVTQKHGEELTDSLKFRKYHYGVGLMTISKPFSGRFDAVEFDDLLEQRGTNLILIKELALNIVDGRPCRPLV